MFLVEKEIEVSLELRAEAEEYLSESEEVREL